MKNISGTSLCLSLVTSLLLAACSPPEKDKVATAAQESAVPKLDLVRAPIPTELEPLKSAANSGDGKAADTLASWYLNREYEFFDPQKAYELGFVVEKVKPALGLRIRSHAIRQGATAKADESVESLDKKVKELPTKDSSVTMFDFTARDLLRRNKAATTSAKLIKRMAKGGVAHGVLSDLAATHKSVTNKEIQEALVNVITELRSKSAAGSIEATGKLAEWLAIRLPAFDFSEKDILAIGVTPKIVATDALTLAQKAADAGDARGTVALIRLSRNTESKLADLRAKVAKFNTPEQTSFIADLIQNAGSEVGVLHDIFPEWSNKDVLTLKRSWLRKAGAAGNLDSYGELAATYFTAEQYCHYKYGATETDRELVQALRCEAEFKPDGTGIQDALKDGIRVGSRDALMMAGVIFLDGNGVARDFATGLDYIQRSARMGNPYAFAVLAKLHFEGGKGVAKSGDNAYLYANMMKSVLDNYKGGASAFGYFGDKKLEGLIATVQKLPSGLEAVLPPDRVTEAQQLTRDWKQGTPLPIMAESDVSNSPRGTGFFIDDKGGMITAAHVVTSCKRVKLVDIDKTGEILARDKANDIALVRFEQTPAYYARIRADAPKVGETIFVYGFPLGGVIAANGSITSGVVSALTGIDNDTGKVQVSAPVQQGNSGGPLFDIHGSVVGMLDSKLNVLRVGKATGDLPQNVNFAIKNSSLASFLDVQSTKYSRPSWLSSLFSKDGEAIAEIAKAVTYKVACAAK